VPPAQSSFASGLCPPALAVTFAQLLVFSILFLFCSTAADAQDRVVDLNGPRLPETLSKKIDFYLDETKVLDLEQVLELPSRTFKPIEKKFPDFVNLTSG